MIAEGEQLLKRAVADALAAEPVLSKRDLEARELSRRALRNVRCGNRDSVCARAALPSDLPANGKVVCSPVTRKCIIGCQDGCELSRRRRACEIAVLIPISLPQSFSSAASVSRVLLPADPT